MLAQLWAAVCSASNVLLRVRTQVVRVARPALAIIGGNVSGSFLRRRARRLDGQVILAPLAVRVRVVINTTGAIDPKAKPKEVSINKARRH